MKIFLSITYLRWKNFMSCFFENYYVGRFSENFFFSRKISTLKCLFPSIKFLGKSPFSNGETRPCPRFAILDRLLPCSLTDERPSVHRIPSAPGLCPRGWHAYLSMLGPVAFSTPRKGLKTHRPVHPPVPGYLSSPSPPKNRAHRLMARSFLFLNSGGGKDVNPPLPRPSLLSLSPPPV